MPSLPSSPIHTCLKCGINLHPFSRSLHNPHPASSSTFCIGTLPPTAQNSVGPLLLVALKPPLRAAPAPKPLPLAVQSPLRPMAACP